MKITLAIALALMIVVTGCADAPTGEVVLEQRQICAVLPMSGFLSVFGQEIARGMELALAGTDVNLIIEDDAYEPKRTVTGVQKLINIDECTSVVVFAIESAKPALSVLEAAQTPALILIDRTQEVVDHPELFTIGYSVEHAGQSMADYAVDEYGAKTSVVVYDPFDFALIVSGAYIERFEENGGLILEEMQLTGDEDFLNIATKIKQMDPDVIYFTVFDSPTFLQRLREQGVGAQLLSNNALVDDFIAAAPDAAEGACKTDLPKEKGGGVGEVLHGYVERYGVEPASPSSIVMGHDAARTLIDAQKHIRGGMDVHDALGRVSFTSVNGDLVDLSDGGAAMRVERIYCIENGVAVLVE